MYKKNIQIILLILIILLAFILRIYQITNVPPGFFCDEAAIGYNAWKLLTTGKDEYGIPWPVFFRSFGDYRTPIPIYSNIPLVVLFGLSEYSVRYTAAVYGIISVILIYFLVKKVGNVRLGMLAAYSLAISPWHLHMSRWGSEYIYFPFFIVLGLHLFVKAYLHKPNILPLAFIVFSFGLYTYYPTWIMTPLIILMITILWFWKRRFTYLKTFFLSYVLLFLIAIPFIKGINDGYVLTRWNSIQKKEDIGIKVGRFAKTYTDSFSIDFLFYKGDVGYPGHSVTRHSVRGMGQLYLFELPLILIGVLVSIKRRKFFLLILVLLLLYPLGSALTNEGPLATRSIIGVIPFSIFSALGLLMLTSYVKKYIPKIGFIILLLSILAVCSFSVHKYLWLYYKDYPLYSSDFWGWQYGPRDIISYFISVEKDYDELYYSGEANAPQIFLPFYTIDRKLGCKKCSLGNIESLNYLKKQLFVGSPGAIALWAKLKGNPPYKVIKEFYYPNGSFSFQAVVYER